jgi:putative ABC transport system ATP-binding protein
MSLLKTESLTKIYGDAAHPVRALDDVSLSIEEGEFVAIMGPSGSGKSTLLYMLGGLEKPTTGKVILHDKDISSMTDDALSVLRRTQIGFVFQFFNLIPVLKARDNVAMPLILDGLKREEALKRADEALAKVGLSGRTEHRPSEMSGGEQQRVALARSMVTNPAVIMGDEPTGNLDSTASDDVVQLMRRAADEWGRTIIIVTHDPRVAAHADRIVFLKDGKIVDENRMKGQSSAEDIRTQLGKVAVR